MRSHLRPVRSTRDRNIHHTQLAKCDFSTKNLDLTIDAFILFHLINIRRWRPFLVDQCSLGWTSNVVLTGDCSSGNGPTAWAHAHRLRRRLHLANAGLSFMADCSALCVGREVLDSILRGEDAFESKPMLEVGGGWLLNA